MTASVTALSELDIELLNAVQRDFPLTSRPFQTIAEQLGRTEQDVVERLQQLEADGSISRFGAVYRPNTVGASTLVAMAVPEQDIDSVAAAISMFSGVNHNYLRENEFNLWFVLTGKDRPALDKTLESIEQRYRLPLLDLPLEESFHIDLGFSL